MYLSNVSYLHHLSILTRSKSTKHERRNPVGRFLKSPSIGPDDKEQQFTRFDEQETSDLLGYEECDGCCNATVYGAPRERRNFYATGAWDDVKEENGGH